MPRTNPLPTFCKTLYDEGLLWSQATPPIASDLAQETNIPSFERSHEHLPFKERVNRQKDLLIENTTLFLTVQYIWEKVCKFPANPATYRKILGEAKTKAEEEEISVDTSLRTSLFREIGKIHPSHSFLSSIQWGILYVRASLVHFLFNRIIKYFANTCITTHLNLFQNYVKSQKEKDDFVMLRTDILRNLERCLTILEGSYLKLTKAKSHFGTIEEMVAEELKAPSANCGRSSQALYKEVADHIIKTTLGGKIPGVIASRILQLFIAPESIVESLVNATSKSAKDNRGYSHSMNLFFLDQLKQIADLLRSPKKVSEVAEPLSEERKRQFSTLIHQLMELLDQSHSKTVQELTFLTKGKGFWPAVQTRHLENWAISLVMEEMIVSLSSLLSLVNEEKIDQLTWQILKITNRSFLPETEISVYQMKKTEDAVIDTIRKILKLTIDKGIAGSLTSSDPCFGTFFMPKPIAIGKKVFSSVRFLPSLLKPIPLGIGAILAAPFLSKEVASRVTEFAKTHQFTKIPTWMGEIDLTSLLSHRRVEMIQDLFQSHTLPVILYVGVPVTAFYWVYSAIHSRASERVQQLFRLSIQPNTYRSALHHLLLIPYVQHLRTGKPSS